MADLTDNSGIVTDNDTITVTCTLKLTNNESGEVVSRFAAVSPIRPDAAFVSNGLIAELFLDKTGTALVQTTSDFYNSIEWTVTDDSTPSNFAGDPPPPPPSEEEPPPSEEEETENNNEDEGDEIFSHFPDPND